MKKESLSKLLNEAKIKGCVQLDNGFKLVSIGWMIKNIKSSSVSKRILAKQLDNYEWREIHASYLVQFFLENKKVKSPEFYLLDKDDYVYSDSSNIDFSYDIENISGIRCYVLTYYDDDMKVVDLGYLAKSVAEETFSKYSSLYDDVSIYTLKDDSSIDADNVDEDAWSKMS